MQMKPDAGEWVLKNGEQGGFPGLSGISLII